MHALTRLPTLAAIPLLLLASTTFAQAESPLPDPIAPAVIGRPLDQIAPSRPARAKVATAKPAPAKRVVPKPAETVHAAAKSAAASLAMPVAAAPQAPAPRAAKQAVDDRVGANTQLAEVGKGTHFARKPLAEGAYIAQRHRAAVRKYYAQHPVMRPAVQWKIGEPVPAGAVAALVPRGVLAALPPVPPGHAYVELGGEVVLVASGSKMVVDGIRRGRDETAMLSR